MIVGRVIRILTTGPILLGLASCGKQMPDEPVSENQRQEINLPKTIFLEAINTRSGKVTLEKDGDITIPSIVLSEYEVSPQHQIKIEVNYINGEAEFDCTWSGLGTIYRFNRCADIDGRDLGLTEANIEKFVFPIDQGKDIYFKISQTPHGETNVKANISIPVEWK